MSPKAQFKFGIVAVLLVAGVLGMLMVRFQSDWLTYAFFGWIGVGSYLVLKIKCPRCGVAVGYQGSFLGISIYAGDMPIKDCNNCGFDLTKPVRKVPRR